MENEILTEQSKKNSSDQGCVNTTKSLLFENDQEYLDTYAEIFALIIEKHRLNRTEVNDKTEYDPIERKKKWLELNKIIAEKEWLFWEKVDKGLKENKIFIIEDLARHYQLSHFEKRVFLVFLCGELSGVREFTMSPSAIVSALDLENSVISRMKNITYFDKGMPLIKQDILVAEEFRGIREIKLNSKLLRVLSKRLKGESVDFPKRDESNKSITTEVESVGFVRPSEYTLDNVILKEEEKKKIMFFLEVYKSKAFQELNIDKTIKNSQGLAFLFYGPPGTGKSMLAEAIASEVGKKLLVAEVPKIVDKHVGETEKNIQAMFKGAKDNDAVLLLDEADSLIYNRSYAYRSWEIMSVNVMLAELERFEGIAILTTNMDKLLDSAVERRMALKVQFKLPTCDERIRIWRKHIPLAFNLDTDVNIEELSRRFEFAGGNIKNAVLNAVRISISRKEKTLIMEDLVFGAKVEEEGMFSLKNKAKIGFRV